MSEYERSVVRLDNSGKSLLPLVEIQVGGLEISVEIQAVAVEIQGVQESGIIQRVGSAAATSTREDRQAICRADMVPRGVVTRDGVLVLHEEDIRMKGTLQPLLQLLPNPYLVKSQRKTNRNSISK